MAYWVIDYRDPDNGWVQVAERPSKVEAEAYIKLSADSLIPSNKIDDRLFDKFRYRKVKGSLQKEAN